MTVPRQQHRDPKHPFGTTLLARNTPENRAKWGEDAILGYVAVAESICTTHDDDNGSSQQCPHYHDYQHDATRESARETPIHLLIASFRDRLCPRTLHNAFQRAENPHRIYVRVWEQSLPDSNLVDDASCWDRYCQEYNENCNDFRSNVRIVQQNAETSQGPTDARSKLSAMIAYDYRHNQQQQRHQWDFQPVEPHDFCMETDSHMDFSDNYDTELILMHHRTKNDYAVLSTYVADMSQNNKDPATVPNLCMVEFTSTIRNWGTKECRNLVVPKLTNACWGAGLSFHRCHAELAVPVDPYLSNVFDGEEGSRGFRFFTHGYDVYTPDRVLVTHDYKGHQSNPVVHTWGHKKKKKNSASITQPRIGQKNQTDWPWMKEIEQERPNIRTIGVKRVNMMLGIGPDDDYTDEDWKEVEQIRKSRFGLGNKRTLEQAIEFSGFNLKERTMEKNKCGNLIWVPFEESEDYGLREWLSRGLNGPETAVLSSDDAVPVGGTDNKSLRAGISDPGVMSVRDLESKSFETSPMVIGILLILTIGVFMVGRKGRRKGERHKN